MTQGLQNLAKNAVEKIGFVVGTNTKPDKCFTHLLVQFKKRQSKLSKFTVSASDPHLFRYYYWLLVMSILAYRRFRWECPEESDWPGKEPIAFPLTENVDPKEIRRERFLYRFMVKYYYNLVKANPNRYTTFPKETCKLRDNIVSIFKPTDHQGKKWGSERGKAIELFPGKKNQKIEQAIYFWKKEDFPDCDLNDPGLKQIDMLNERPPANSIDGEILDRLLDDIRKSDFWKNWEEIATRKQKAIKLKGATEEILRSHLKEEANKALSVKLYSRNNYQPLELEVGYIQQRTEPDKIDTELTSEKRETYSHNRDWIPFNWCSLLDSRDVYILSSDLGTGKTTFLRHLQKEILEKSCRIPIFIESAKIENWDFKNKDSFISELSKELQPWLTKNKAIRFLKRQLNRNILLLVDGLDQIKGVNTTCGTLLDNLCKYVTNSLIVATQPSTVTDYEKFQTITFLRLKPFSATIQKEYFGDDFGRACQLCKDHQWMLGIPILAFMVRTLLIEPNLDYEVKSRSDLYKRYVDYIVYRYKYEGSEPSLDLREKIRSELPKIAYEALANMNIKSGKIPLNFCLQCISIPDLQIDSLPRCGFVEIITDRTEGFKKYLLFTHPSFQQFFAAEWACRDNKRKSYLIENYWDPKWRKVIKFLAGMGMVGKDFVRRLYLGSRYDNAIHSKLFLAAECVSETQVRSTIANGICSELLKVSKIECFLIKAILGLVKVGTVHSHNQAWDLLLKAPKTSEYQQRIYQEIESLKLLYLPERLDWVLQNIYPETSWLPSLLLNAWGFFVPDKIIEQNISKLDCPTKQEFHTALKILLNLAHSLNEVQVQTVFEKLCLKRDYQEYLLDFLSSLGRRPKTEYLRWIMEYGFDYSTIRERIAVLWAITKLCHYLSSDEVDEVDQVLQFLMKDQWYDRHYPFGFTNSIANRLNDSQIDLCIQELKSKSYRRRLIAVKLLGSVIFRLSKEQVRLFEKTLFDKRQSICCSAIKPAAAVYNRLGTEARSELLKMLWDNRAGIRIESLKSVRNLEPYIEEKELEAVFWNLDQSYIQLCEARKKGTVPKYVDAKLYSASIEACAYLVHRFDKAETWRLVRRLDCVGMASEDEVLLGRIASCLNEAQCNFILQRIQKSDRMESEDKAWHLIPVLSPTELRKESIEYLRGLLSSSNCGKSMLAYKKLYEVYEKGKLLADGI